MSGADVALMMFDFAPSGVVRNALRIAKAARDAGLAAEVWTVQESGPMRESVPSGVTVRSFGNAVGDDYGRKQRRKASARAADALATLLRDQQPRVAFSAGNHFHELAALAVGRARPVWKGRLVGRVSNALPRFSWAPNSLLWSIYKRAAARRRLNAMQRLVTVSEALRRDLVRQLLIPASKVGVIPNGIDIAETRARASEPLDHPWFADESRPVILGAGRLVAQKNFEALLSAFAEARKSQPMRLLLLGEGPERSALEKQARDLGVADDVMLAGYVANPLPYFRHASLFVLPSRWEGMSNALLEALALGCPSVATRCTGSVELLGEDLSNQIVPVDDGDALVAAILAGLNNPPARELFLARATHYELKATLDGYVDLLRREADSVQSSGNRSA